MWRSSSITRRPSPWPCRSPATTTSQSTARLKPSRWLGRNTVLAAPEAHRHRCRPANAAAEQSCGRGPRRRGDRTAVGAWWSSAGRRSGPRPSQRRPGAPGHGEPAGSGSRVESRSTSSCSPAIIDDRRLASQHPCPPTTSRLRIRRRVISRRRSSSWWRG